MKMKTKEYTRKNEEGNLLDFLLDNKAPTESNKENKGGVKMFKVITTRRNSTPEWRADFKNWNTIASVASEREASLIMNYAMKTDSGEWGRSSDNIFKIIKEDI